MSKLIELGEYVIPTFVVCYLDYGDSGDMTDEEISQADDFVDGLGGPLIFDYGDSEAEFVWRNDITKLGGDCVRATVYRVGGCSE